jgi:hypothetical protein
MNELAQMIGTCMGLVTRLRTISERSRDADLKGVVADLLLQLAEMQLKLDEVLTGSASVKGQGKPQGELCPRCGELGWKPVDTRGQGSVGVSGRMSRTYKCSKCGLKEEVSLATR